jgi:hypothetical protein
MRGIEESGSGSSSDVQKGWPAGTANGRKARQAQYCED